MRAIPSTSGRRRAWVLAALVAGGLAIRLALAPFTSWSPDMIPWLVRVQELQHGLPLYQHLTFSYPPLYGHLLALVAWPFLGNSGNLGVSPPALRGLSISSSLLAGTVPTPALTLAFKLPSILADVGTALAMAGLARRLGLGRVDHLVAAAWLFNPLSIFVTAVHGQFDALPVLATVLAVLLMLDGAWLFAGVALSLGVLFKIYPGYLLPVLLLAPVLARARREGSIASVLFAEVRLLVGLLVPSLLFALPLADQHAFTAVFSRTQTTGDVGGGLGLWFPAVIPPVAQALIPYSPTIRSVFSLLLAVGTAGLLIAAWIKRREGGWPLVELMGGILCLVLLTASATNPQYVLWPLPFLILIGFRAARARWVPVLLSVVPILFYFAMWAGNGLAFLVPAVTYYSWPVRPTELAASLQASYFAVGPAGLPLRYLLMAGVGALTTAGLLVACVEALTSGRPLRLGPRVRPLAQPIRESVSRVLESVR